MKWRKIYPSRGSSFELAHLFAVFYKLDCDRDDPTLLRGCESIFVWPFFGFPYNRDPGIRWNSIYVRENRIGIGKNESGRGGKPPKRRFDLLLALVPIS